MLLFDCLKRTFLTVAVTYFSQRDTECYAIEMEQSEPDGVMTTPNDQFTVFITAVVLFWNVMLGL